RPKPWIIPLASSSRRSSVSSPRGYRRRPGLAVTDLRRGQPRQANNGMIELLAHSGRDAGTEARATTSRAFNERKPAQPFREERWIAVHTFVDQVMRRLPASIWSSNT